MTETHPGYLRAVDDGPARPMPTPRDLRGHINEDTAIALAGLVNVPVADLPARVDTPTSQAATERPTFTIAVVHDGGREVVHGVQRWTFGDHSELNVYGRLPEDGRVAKIASFGPYTVKWVERLDRTPVGVEAVR